MANASLTWKTFKVVISTPDLPGIGPEPRTGRLPVTGVEKIVEQFLAQSSPMQAIAPVLRSAALLWHDHLEASHEISQGIASADGSFLHGIMHRREPDYGNAKYWFQRVGRHPAFSMIAARLLPLLQPDTARDLAGLLTAQGEWDPFRFIDACERAADRTGESVRVLQSIQELEFDCLLKHLFDTRVVTRDS